MKINIEELSPVLRGVAFEFPAEEVEELMVKVYRDAATQVRLKGFRKGKIPRKVLSQFPNYRKMVHEEVRQGLHQKGIQELLEDDKLEILALPETNDGVLKEKKEYSFSIKIEVRPSLELPDFSSLKVKFETVVISDDDVNEALKDKQEESSVLEPVEDRGAKEGDQLKVDFVASKEGSEEEADKKEDITMALEDGTPEALREGLIGAKVDEVREILVPVEGVEEGEETENFLYKITVKEISVKVLPALDDEFAKDNSFESFEEMKESLKKEIVEAENKTSETRAKASVMKQLLEAVEVPVPASVLEEQITQKLRNVQMWSRLPAELINNPQMRESFRDDASAEIQRSIVLHQVIKNEEIEVEESDIDAELKVIADSQGQSIAYLKSVYDEEKRKNLASDLKSRKAMDFLLDAAEREEETLSREARTTRIGEEEEAERKVRAEKAKAKEEEEHVHGPDCNHDQEKEEHVHGPDCNHDH